VRGRKTDPPCAPSPSRPTARAGGRGRTANKPPP